MAWQPIETAPKDGTAFIAYFGNAQFRDINGNNVSFGEPRDTVERMELGFMCGGRWCFSGTGHDMFEAPEYHENLPTHWQPLPAPPEN